MNKFAQPRGFTLLEILIAMAIFAIIGVASAGLLSRVMDGNELSQDRFAQLEQIQRAMLIIERDLLQAVARPARIEGELNEIVMASGRAADNSDADSIAFVRTGWHNPQFMLPRSNMQAVAYRLKDGKLERLYGNYVDNVIGFEPKIRVLLENVEDFKVSFFIKEKGAPERERDWQENYVGTVLPRAIAIDITTQEHGRIRREFVISGGLNNE
ncbi:type II secretion system minor pseudopilin GspJ [Alteromonas facilis]|uniref:type II secretion system minor pseudopilin GspJ n=1 Tax=Alteromonas facilis TaxID=2048004 RepID=UPI000C282EF7|nr:type II secretion system minor pseudopilin GspJ [Alteromonas facilis]